MPPHVKEIKDMIDIDFQHFRISAFYENEFYLSLSYDYTSSTTVPLSPLTPLHTVHLILFLLFLFHDFLACSSFSSVSLTVNLIVSSPPPSPFCYVALLLLLPYCSSILVIVHYADPETPSLFQG